MFVKPIKFWKYTQIFFSPAKKCAKLQKEGKEIYLKITHSYKNKYFVLYSLECDWQHFLPHAQTTELVKFIFICSEQIQTTEVTIVRFVYFVTLFDAIIINALLMTADGSTCCVVYRFKYLFSEKCYIYFLKCLRNLKTKWLVFL